MSVDDFSKLGGWVDDQEAVQEVVKGLPIPVFTCPNPQSVSDKEDVLLYEAPRKVLGKDLEPIAQQIGDCVSFGFQRAVDIHQCVMILNNHRASFKPTATESIYALSRVEVGGGRLRGDGSVGAWAAKAINKYGILARQKYDGHDLTKYSGLRAKEWGSRGLPDELEDDAREHLVKTVSLVRTVEELSQAIRSGFPVAVCSNQGFTTKRDSKGFCHPRGSWAHCMEIEGEITSDGDLSFVIAQSWGPNSPSGPRSDYELPVNCFRVHADVIGRMLAVGDSFSISGFEGYEPLNLDWSGFMGR